MDEAYRGPELEIARGQLEFWRAVYNRLNFDGSRQEKKEKRNAAEEVEFWGNKVSFLANAK